VLREVNPRIRILIVVILLSSIAAFWLFKRDSWVAVTPSDGLFSISMPATPAENETPFYSGTRILRSYAVTNRQTVYAVSFADYPKDFFAKSSPELIVEQGANQMVRAVSGGGLVQKSSVAVQGFPGRLVISSDPQSGYTIRSLACIAGLRHYIIQTTKFRDATSSEDDINRFFDSFKISAAK